MASGPRTQPSGFVKILLAIAPRPTGDAAYRSVSSKGYSLATCIGAEWVNTPAPETCDATRNATMTAGTLISLRT
jgi:hypothetical protein